jgi:hypothetical protein
MVAMTETATIQVKRAAVPWRDRKRAYKIVLDDRVVVEVRDGQEFRIVLPAGTHTVRIKIDWSGSAPLRFSVNPGGVAAFACEPAGGAVSSILDLLLRRQWVSLRQVTVLKVPLQVTSAARVRLRARHGPRRPRWQGRAAVPMGARSASRMCSDCRMR